jgi:hypothetical protein
MADRSTLSGAEIGAILTATSEERRYKGRNRVTKVGVDDTPTLDLLRSRKGFMATPIRGGYKATLSGLRGKKLTTISGRDILTFDSVDTLFDVTFSTGMVHLGDEWVHQQLREAGITIDYKSTKVDLPSIADSTWEVLINLAEVKSEAFEDNFRLELAKMVYRSNVADPKAFQGIDAIINRSTNSTGTVGNKNRSNAYLRHQLSTGIASADIELELSRLARACRKRNGERTGAGKTRLNVCGEAIYDAIVTRMFSGSTGVTRANVTTTRNLEQAKSAAQAAGQKMGIGFPDNAIEVAGLGIVMIEPLFEKLDLEDQPSVLWQRSFLTIDPDHLQLLATKGLDGVMRVHPMPSNQLVTRASMLGEYSVVADKFDCHGALIWSGS